MKENLQKSLVLVVKRKVQNRLNLGDSNEVELNVTNQSIQPITFHLHEGFPVEMQERSKVFKAFLKPKEKRVFTYEFTPKERGEFIFGNVFLLVSSVFNLISRKVTIELEECVKYLCTKNKSPCYLRIGKTGEKTFSNKRSEKWVFNKPRVLLKGGNKICLIGTGAIIRLFFYIYEFFLANKVQKKTYPHHLQHPSIFVYFFHFLSILLQTNPI